MVSIPASRAARASASASSSVAGPSSIPGRTWPCMSIRLVTLCLAARRPRGRSYDPRGPRPAEAASQRRSASRGGAGTPTEGMSMFKKMVVGTDGSQTATEAVRQAIEFAKPLGASIDIVSAYEPVPAQRLRQERRD
ncbi:MAG: universal stress protein, partial [Solirubrobacteraceae bacterium]